MDHHPTVEPAKPPVGTGVTPLVAQLLGLGLVALGAVGVQDLLTRTGAVAGTPWTSEVVGWLDGLSAGSVWVAIGGVVAAALGLLLLAATLRPRPRRTLELRATTGVRLRARDLARVVHDSLETVDGVTEVSVRTRRRSVHVVATTVVRDERRAEVRAELQRRLEPTLATLQHAPRPRIKVKEGVS